MKNTKWNKLRILMEWLEQGRLIEVEMEFANSEPQKVNYGMDVEGNVIHMIGPDSGVVVDSIRMLFKIIDKIPEDEFFIMSSEVALTKIGQESAEKRSNRS